MAPENKQPHGMPQRAYIPPAPPSHYYPIRPKKDRTWIIVIVIIAIVGLIFFAPILFFLFFPFSETEHVTEFSEDVAISEGGHFKYACGYLSKGDKIQISITVTEGGPVDVYIMQNDQYEGAYEVSNVSVISFSALFKKENITMLNKTYELNKTGKGGKRYVVIDNRDTPLTLNDATPTGPVLVKTKIKTIETYSFD